MPMQFKGVPVAPLTGLFDAVSQPDNMDPGSVRWRQNFQTLNAKTIRRGHGWEKLLNSSNYNNADFHDQLLLFQGATREPVTHLNVVESSRKVRWLIACTQSRIAKLNAFSGNWQ